MTDADTRIEEARAAFDRRAWEDARSGFAATDSRVGLGPQDLRRLAESAFLTGRSEQAEDAWSRAYTEFRDREQVLSAVRCAFWLALVLLTGPGDAPRGSGWIARAQRLLDGRGLDECPARGFLLLPAALQQLEAGDPETARELFCEAAELGARFDEGDLRTIGRLGQGQSLIRAGRPDQGIALLDEVMLDLDGGQVSTIAAGIVQCAAILASQQVLDVGRAQQWTDTLERWCRGQPDLVPFRGECLVHRSELATLRGDWDVAVDHAERAVARLGDPPDSAAGMAHYQRAELHRLRGETGAAEAAYARAADRGRDPQPGLALLRIDQGRTDAAVAAIRRVLAQRDAQVPPVAGERAAPRSRPGLVAAAVEVLLAADDVEGAQAAADELAELADQLQAPLALAMAAGARGAVLLADGHADLALAALTRARSRWVDLTAPVEVARVRVRLAQALRAVGDVDTAIIEEAAAVRVFEEVGATPDLERFHEVVRGEPPAAAAGLTPREVEVVRLVADGLTNRQIADELVISDRTVARHLHNVFTKLDLPNRSAATAYAYEHDLL